MRGVLALLGRSLRVDGRSLAVHLARVGLMAAIYVSLSYAYATSTRFGAPGLRFFRANVYLNLMFLTLLGIGFFSTAISEEKEEDTLGLMQMAGISPLGILLGKIGGRLMQALLLIAVQYPFTLLAVTMGGVTQNQVQAAYVGLTSYMLLLAGFGLLCSTVAPRNRTAGALMILGMIVYVAVPYVVTETLSYLAQLGSVPTGTTWRSVLDWVASTCIFLQVETILTSNFGESAWSVQAVSNLAAGALSFVLSWVLFGVGTRTVSTEATSRGMLTRQRGLFCWFSPGRPRINPFVWKDFHFVAGGLAMLIARVVFYVGLFCACWALAVLWGGSWNGRWQELIALYQVFTMFALSLDLALLAGRTLHDEVRGQTVSSLVMLPESIPFVVYSKYAGTFVAAVPGLSFLALACLTSYDGRHNTGEFLEEAAGWFFIAHLLLVPHLAAAFSLFVRWGAVPLGIGVMIGSVFCWISFFEANRVSERSPIVWIATLGTLGGCAACHVVILRRMMTLAAR